MRAVIFMSEEHPPTEPLPAGWRQVDYLDRDGSQTKFEYWNPMVRQYVAQKERPTEPVPTGIELLRSSKAKSGFHAINAVGKNKSRYQAKWWCSDQKKQRALRGCHGTPEEAAEALLAFVEGGAVFEDAVIERNFKRGTKPPPPPKEAKVARKEPSASKGSGGTIKNPITGKFEARVPAVDPPRDPTLPTSVPLPVRVEDITDAGMRAMWEEGGSSRAPSAVDVEPLD